MTKIRGNVLLQMATGAVPMSQIGAQGFYLRKNVPWGKKPQVIANLPYTIESPTPAQLEQRSRFGHFAEQYRDQTGFVNGLPIAAGEMKGKKFGPTTAPHRGKSRRSYHTLAEIDRMLSASGKKKERVYLPEETGARVYPRRVRRY